MEGGRPVTTESQGFIAPQFDADQGRKLAIICSKGTLDMAYPGLIMGNGAVHENIEALPVPPVPEFPTQLTDAGAHLWACRMSVDMMKLTQADFIEEVEDIINVSDFLELTREAQILF